MIEIPIPAVVIAVVGIISVFMCLLAMKYLR